MAKPTFTLLNTRPAHQAQALSQAVLEAQGAVVNCPLMAVQVVEVHQSALAGVAAFDKVIFTSANAIQGLVDNYQLAGLTVPWHGAQAASNLCKPTLFAIGRATQQSALDLGLPMQPLASAVYDSEALLANPLMLAVQQQKILIVKGRGGRDVLQDVLLQRGAQVETLEVYQRYATPFCEVQWAVFIRSVSPILLITSLESFEHLRAGLQKSAHFSHFADLNDPAWSFLTGTVVFSQRIRVAMIDLGWSQPIEVVSTQSQEGILQAIEKVLGFS